ncbi:MAG: aminotransferase class I/II-fold pyridoxal phosphate-dependent enzyme [Oligoflexia bacterium]|nr:aminotransferase class I/II-fold pyridoxal phosphate-dependent enzyme [Oligoflexia bacterium]
MDIQKFFAQRIGGTEFGKVQQTFKFTLIENAKRAFMAEHPDLPVIDMGVGEPEELAPERIRQVLAEQSAIKANRIYPCNGTQPFRDAAARYLKRLIGEDFNPSTEIMHCIGAKAALAQIPLAFVNPGDVVLATAPGYPTLPKVARWLGAEVIDLPLLAENSYLPSLSELDALIQSKKPKLLLLNYPNNPTGALATPLFYKQVVEWAQQYQFLIVQDAAYSDLVLDGKYCSPLQIPGGRDVCLEIYSLSKGYNMQGYRLGFVVGSAALVKAFGLVKDNTDNGQFIPIQLAGVSALDECAGYLDYNRSKYARRMQRVVEILAKAGIVSRTSAGTFFLYIPVPSNFGGRNFPNAQAFSDFLMAQFGLVSVPWDEAGPHVRLSMTFEVGTTEFPTEESVFRTLAQRMQV